MKHKNLFFKGLIIALSLLLLVSVRLMENQWFPEPLIRFFASDSYLSAPLPALGFQHYFTIVLRYLVNSVLSLIILFMLFGHIKLMKWLVQFYIAGGIVLFLLFLLAVFFYQPGNYGFLFYVRRLLIQPVFLFILIPAVYFVRKSGQIKH